MDCLFKGNVISGSKSTVNNPDPFEDGSGIALYKLDGNANDTTGDYDGTPSGITYTDGVFGQCAVFDAETDNIDVPQMNTTKFETTGVSFSFWIYFNTITSALDYPFVFARNNEYLYGYMDTATTFQWSVDNSIKIHATVTNGQWYHLVMSYNPLDGKIELYKDNVLADSAISGAIATIYGNNPNVIGNRYQKDRAIDGKIDQFRVFNRALTADEVTILYNERKV